MLRFSSALRAADGHPLNVCSCRRHGGSRDSTMQAMDPTTERERETETGGDHGDHIGLERNETPDISYFTAHRSRCIYELFGGLFKPVGFLNEGNKCYRNVCLQAIFSISNFVESILSHDPSTSILGYCAKRGLRSYALLSLKLRMEPSSSLTSNRFVETWKIM